ncbi:MAG TPA: hypothetical protein VL625_06310 [Patescibacteria group bacterium]|nr:hypothetical protein [Patescibacteria group bacterium]
MMMKNKEKNSELTVLLISDNDADITEITRQLETTMGRACHLWHCPSVVRSSGFFRMAVSEVDIVLLDLDLVASNSPRDMFRQLHEIVRGIPIIVFTESGEHELALMVVEEGAADNITKGQLSTDPYKLRDAIEFALARMAIAGDMVKEHDEQSFRREQDSQKNEAARSREIAALTNAMAEVSVVLEKTIAHANENLRKANELAASKLKEAIEYGENLVAEARAEASSAKDLAHVENADLHREKDQTIHWLSGGYSIDSNPDTSS